MKQTLLAGGGALLLTLALYGLSLVPNPPPRLSPLENIHGIPYPHKQQNTLIIEPLAHADIYLDQPVFAKELVLKIEFIPGSADSLAVGVRENEFWLSYPKYELYNRRNPQISSTSPITSTVTIPLTDKLQEPDQSLDLMFFAESENPQWELVHISAETKHVQPNYAQVKDYARAILKRERAL